MPTPLRTFSNSPPTRREWLRCGALGAAGLTLSQLLRMEAWAGVGSSTKAVVNIHLDGGPSQYETIDPKPEAPLEIRGPFLPIETSVPGIRISELMPQVARLAEQFVFVRSLVGSDGQHNAFQCQSGFAEKDLKSFGGRPAFGSVIAKLQCHPDDPAPGFVDLMQGRPLVRDSARPGFLGPAYRPFRPDISAMFERELEAGMKGELARRGTEHSLKLTLDERLTLDRLADRQSLRTGLDRVKRELDGSGMMAAMDQFDRQAVGILTSGRLAEALDLSKEDPAVLAQYTASGPQHGVQDTTSEGANAPQKFLLARRLIEAGVRVVSVSISDFDTHSKNFPRMQNLVPIVDHGLAAFVTDLKERGLWDDVMVVVWGEFGRTPVVNSSGGRDHWPRVSPCLLAGGGLRCGQVIGSTDRTGAEPRSRPVTYKDIFRTLYRHLGIDAKQETLTDPQGRPQYLLDEGEVPVELA